MPGVLSAAMGALCLIAGAQPSGSDQPQRADSASKAELMLVEVAINGVPRDGEYVVARQGERFWVRPEDLDRWRMRRPELAPETIEDERLVPLSAFPDVTVRFDAARQRLDLIVPPARFLPQQLSPASGRTGPTPATFAAFLNYDLSFQYDGRLTGTAFLEGGVSDDWGLVSSTMTVGRNGGAGTVTRLDTFYLRDFPDALTRLVVGDTVTDARDWSRQVRFGGVRLGTEFALQPELVTFPVPDFGGRAAVPSNVELLVNDAVRYQAQVDQGPFSIIQAPVVTGAGDVTLVVRDALGVERRVRTSYYVSSRLLRRGLAAWSLEGGVERRDYGIRSFRYHNPFAAGSYRYGLTDWLTVEGRAEVGGEVQMAGAGANLIVPDIGEIGVAGAVSRGDDGKGSLYRIFFSRISPDWNIGVSYQRASRHFDQLGIDRDEDRITEQLQASAGVSLGRGGSIAVSWTDLTYAAGDRTRLASANYSVALGDKAYLNLFALRTKVEDAGWETMAGIGLTIPLGSRSSAYAQADSRNVLAELRQTTPTEGGWGYRLAASAGEADYQQAELRWRGDVGEVSVEAARFDGREGLRAIASGGLLIAGDRAYATRRVEGGLGVVEVPGQPEVRIYQENRLVTRTDRQGRAIIPDLRAYEENRISLAPSDLPLDVRMPSDTMIVVPRFRGAAQARFAVERDRPATIVVTMPDGSPVETGANVRTSTGESAFVGYGGEIFVRELQPGMSLEVETGKGPCRIVVPDRSAGETLPRIGPLRCQ
ncbi:fimbria/pilus outer membrane usher protein [Sphingomonas cannabina]|uniref:fimbria/pilus outer membrane usher protein n=1 Tax=Sphingomonas cannabina TaxID=2899123 RepID=UPI001F1B2F5D|nr:fimbria/pilus outer membrane usher protein [Sphingomonas cannabina]UIJ46868.1 fimbria/pilus outer membrane usher protein [Sphingomonas cannabina]